MRTREIDKLSSAVTRAMARKATDENDLLKKTPEERARMLFQYEIQRFAEMPAEEYRDFLKAVKEFKKRDAACKCFEESQAALKAIVEKRFAPKKTDSRKASVKRQNNG